MRILLTLLMLFFCVAAAQAQNNLPDAPSKTNDAPAPLTAATSTESVSNPVVFHKKIFWPLVGACATAGAFDVQMSYDYDQSHPTARETTSAWLVGRRPSLGRYYATIAVLDAGTALASYKLLHSRRKALRVVGWSMLGGLTYVYIYDDIAQATRSQ